MKLREQQGSALISVLSMIVIFTIMVGIILSVEVIQNKFIHKAVFRTQALYTAEACVYRAMQKLRNDPFWETSDIRLDEFPCVISVGNAGGYFFIRSIARRGNEQITVRAKVAEKPPANFDAAIYLWDEASRLNVAGTTTIKGDIEVGQWGVRQSTLDGIHYSGELIGVTRFNDQIRAPFFDDKLIQRYVHRLDSLLAGEQTAYLPSFAPSLYLPAELPVFFIDGDLFLSPTDSTWLSTPKIIAASRDLVVNGPLSIADGSHFLAGKRLLLRGEIEGENAVFYGAQNLSVEKSAVASGQFLSRQDIHVADSSYLLYPSFLYLGGASENQAGHIELAGTAHVDGVVIHGNIPNAERQVKGRIVIGKDAVLRGGLYNPYETELHGTVYGSIATARFFFYRSPTRYINWLYDAKIDVELRPESFHVPPLFNDRPDLSVMSWDIDWLDSGE